MREEEEKLDKIFEVQRKKELLSSDKQLRRFFLLVEHE